MFRDRWLRQWLGLWRLRGTGRTGARRSPRSFRPVMETLEDRLTPAQLVGSYTALVSAIAADTAPNTNYVIDITNSFTFSAGGQVIVSGLSSTSTLTIEGQGGTNYTLTGNGNRLFDVQAGQNLTLNDLTLTGGGGVSQGGAIEDQGGTVTLSGVTLRTNTAVGTPSSSAEGGGVYVSGGGSLILKNCTIANNVAQGVAGTSAAYNGGPAIGGGVFVSGAGIVQISASTLTGNRAQGGAGFSPTTSGGGGGTGGTGVGGGVGTLGSGGWTVTLNGDILSDNVAVGGAGGSGAAGSNATGPNSLGGAGGAGGTGGGAGGGGLYVNGTGTVTVLNDLDAPLTNPSILIDNSAIGGVGGMGGIGGTSTGTANNSNGGTGGAGDRAFGGGVLINFNFTGTATIGNTTFYGDSAMGGDGAAGGAAGTGGTGLAGTAGITGSGGSAQGGGTFVDSGDFTMVNSTVAANTAMAGTGSGGSAYASGGGIALADSATVILDNNTITGNTTPGSGGGLTIINSGPTLINNIIQGNLSNGSPSDLVSSGTTPTPLTDATDNFITAVSPSNAVNPATNIVGNYTAQLGAAVGIDSNGNPSGGPIYYPLAPGAVSIDAGATSVLDTIVGVEGITPPTDEVGDLRTTDGADNGAISLGAVQPLVANAPVATTVTAGNATIPFYGTNASPAFTVPVAVATATSGTASGGSVSLSLVVGATTTFLGSAVVGANGVATITVPAGTLAAGLSSGTYELIESYSGDASFAASTAFGTLTVTIDATSVVAGNASLNYFGTSPSPAFQVVVGVNSPDGTVNGGTVSINLVSDNTTTSLGSGTVTNGTATVTVAAGTLPADLQTGSYQLIETYSGSPPFAGSSADGTLTIVPAATSIVVSSSVNPAVYGQSLAFTATVVNTSNNAVVPTGMVQFMVDGVDFGAPVAVDASGQAVSASDTLVTGATHSVTAVYTNSAGDFTGSTSATLTQSLQTAVRETYNSQTVLFVGGASVTGSIVVGFQNNNTAQLGVRTITQGVQQTTFTPMAGLSGLVVYGNGGGLILVGQGVTLPEFLFAGDTNTGLNTTIEAGGGPSVVVGGNANDLLEAGQEPPSILIAGLGSDTLMAQKGDSILIAGTTDFDANLPALMALLTEWSRTGESYLQRVANLSNATVSGVAPNGSYTAGYFLDSSTVQDNGVSNMLVGGSGPDWFFANQSGVGNNGVIDVIEHEYAGEIVTTIQL